LFKSSTAQPYCHRVAFSLNGSRLASAAGGKVKIYDAKTLPEKP
jgi:hypothetical protein